MVDLLNIELARCQNQRQMQNFVFVDKAMMCARRQLTKNGSGCSFIDSQISAFEG